MTASMSEWYFGIEEDTMVKNMMMKALELEPDNILYQWAHYIYLDLKDPENKKQIISYAKRVLADGSPFKKILKPKGALGECLLGLITNWSKRVINTLAQASEII